MGEITPKVLAAMRQTMRRACPRCGAKTEKQAESMCRPQALADTGDYTCPSDWAQVDAQGWFLGPTKAAEKADAIYWEEMGRKQEAELLLDAQAIAMDRRMTTPPYAGYAGGPDDLRRLPGMVPFINPDAVGAAQGEV